MGDELYQFDCEECGSTVVTASHPQQDENDVLLCPSCSIIDVDYTVAPDDYDDPTIVQL